MVANDLGIAFLFEVAVEEELGAGTLSVINIPGFRERREFNFVQLKNGFFRERYMGIYRLLKQTFSGK